MDEIFQEINCRFESNSIMMRLLKSAMDKAHERLQTKDGPIERLNESSKFYELAIIQLEGCLRLVQEETDSYILESSHEMLSDLMEIKERLRGRLKETELAIVRIDRELMKRSENDFKLMQALELREREVASLRADLKVERTKSEGVQEFVLSNQARGDEGKEGDICELKNSLDKQVWNIKQKLEDERIHLTNGMRKMNSAPPILVNLKPDSEQNIVIEQMSSDMDILKGTLDLAFGRMQNAEVRPLEKQWRWTIEKNTVSILIRGFMSDLQQNFEAELMRKRANQVPVGLSNEHWLGLIDDMTSLCHELEALISQNEVQVKRAPSPHVHRTSSEPLPEVDYMKDVPEDDQEADGRSHYVAKMIKNHESIIRKKNEKLHWLTREILRGKGYLSGKGDKDHGGLERRIQGVIVRLDNVIKWNAKLGEKVHFQEEKTSKSDIADESHGLDAELNSKMRKMKQEREDSNLQTIIMEEIYIILVKGLMKDFYLELYKYDTESLISEDIYYTVCCGAVKDFVSNHGFIVLHYLESTIREDVYAVFFREMVKKWKMGMESHAIESLLKEDVCMVFFREMVEAWKLERDAYEIENLIREDIYQFVIIEAVKEDAHVSLRECEVLKNLEDASTISSVSNKLEKALQQLVISKALLRELGCSLDIEVCDQINPIMKVSDDREQSFCQPNDNQVQQFKPSDSVFPPLPGFPQVLVDVERLVHEKLETNCLRLEEVKHQIDQFVQLVASVRKRELLYRKAFLRRCHNLQLAETEVDLLGDQVNVLLGLLEKIYSILDQYSPVLSRYFEVSDILMLIKKELIGGAAHLIPI